MVLKVTNQSDDLKCAVTHFVYLFFYFYSTQFTLKHMISTEFLYKTFSFSILIFKKLSKSNLKIKNKLTNKTFQFVII